MVPILSLCLAGHDRMPSAFLVYLHLAAESEKCEGCAVRASHQTMSEITGLSKSAVRKSIRLLPGRKLLRGTRASATATPEYRVLRPWRRR